ncbi:MAG: nitroreductase family protein [Candidatus Coproplasma sp.]
MNTLEAIRRRKSVRTYRSKPVEAEKIRTIVEAGNMAAMTRMAGQVYFNVITNPSVLQLIVSGAKAEMQKTGVEMLVKVAEDERFNPIYNAPVGVVVSVGKADSPDVKEMGIANAACASENMLLAATESGLGSCYLASPNYAFNNPEIAAAAQLPVGTVPVSFIVFGYTDDVVPHAPRPERPENIIYVD